MRGGNAQMQLAAAATPAEIGVEPVQIRGAGLAKAVVVRGIAGRIDREISVLLPEFQDTGRAPIRAAVGRYIFRLSGESVLKPNAERAAERVEAEVGFAASRLADSIAVGGIRSQFTVSPNASLKRAPLT